MAFIVGWTKHKRIGSSDKNYQIFYEENEARIFATNLVDKNKADKVWLGTVMQIK